jgi:hypothetical protein
LSYLTLAAYAGGFMVVGYGVGLMHYHFANGFFLSLMRAEDIQHVLATAEARIVRRKARGSRRRPVVGRQDGRHLASGKPTTPSAVAEVLAEREGSDP